MLDIVRGLSLSYYSIDSYQEGQENRACGRHLPATFLACAQVALLTFQAPSFALGKWANKIKWAPFAYLPIRLLLTSTQKDNQSPSLLGRAGRLVTDHDSRIFLVASLVSTIAALAIGHYAYAGASLVSIAYKAMDHTGLVPRKVGLFVESYVSLIPASMAFANGGLFAKVSIALKLSSPFLAPVTRFLSQKTESLAARLFNRHQPLLQECYAKVEKKTLNGLEILDIIQSKTKDYEINPAHCSEVPYEEPVLSDHFDQLSHLFPGNDVKRLVKVLKGEERITGSHHNKGAVNKSFQRILPYLQSLDQVTLQQHAADLSAAGKSEYAAQILQIAGKILNIMDEIYSKPLESDSLETRVMKDLAKMRREIAKNTIAVFEPSSEGEEMIYKQIIAGFLPSIQKNQPPFSLGYVSTFISGEFSQIRQSVFYQYQTRLTVALNKIWTDEDTDYVKRLTNTKSLTKEQSQRILCVSLGILRKKAVAF